MKFTKDIYFDKRITENSVVNILYTGKLYKNASSKVYIVYKYGINCDTVQEKEMILTSTGFVVDININGKYSFDFHFKNDNEEIDNNRGQDYTATIHSNSYVVESGNDLMKLIDSVEDENLNKTNNLKNVNQIEDEKNKEKIDKSNENETKENYKMVLEDMKRYKETRDKRLKNREYSDSLYDYANSKEAKGYDLGRTRVREFEDEHNYREKIKKKRRDEKDKKRRRKIRLICSIILMCCITYGIIYFLESKNVQKESQDLLNTVVVDNTAIENNNITMDEPVVTERMLKIRELNSQYPDLKAWIEIGDSNINYPIMHGQDNSFYMNHDYKKEYSRWGSLFVDKDYDWNLPSSNLLIYGHNFSDGIMLSDLLKYKDKSFFDSHPTIKFTTPEEDTEYEIIAVFYSRVYYKSEKNVFRYYYFVNAETEEEYNEFVENAKKASIYDTGKTAEYGDQLLTLSTCEYSQEDGRFVVVARKKQ